MNMDSRDQYYRGLQEGMMMARRDIGKYVQGMLLKLYELSQKQTGDQDNNEAIFIASSIYAYIYGTDRLFTDMYRQKVLLTEPEIRYGRVANNEESNLPLEELSARWSRERLAEEKDKD